MDATNYLTSLGHRQIVYINGPSSVILCRDRLKGYGIAVERAQIPFHDDYVCEGDFTMAGGYAKIKFLLRNKIPFTAIFCANDAMPMGAMKALREVGLSVPENVSVVGFDNIDIASFSEPGLTTVSQPFDDIGTKAMEMWLTINAGDKAKYPVKIPHKLIIRGSCASPKTHG